MLSRALTIKPDIQRPVAPALRWLPYLYAAGAVFWLIELAQLGGFLAASNGRDQLKQTLIHGGITQGVEAWLVLESAIVIFLLVAAATLHATAYFGLRKRRLWGWVIAVMVAVAWSLVLVGIPVLLVLLQRPTRQAFGMS